MYQLHGIYIRVGPRLRSITTTTKLLTTSVCTKQSSKTTKTVSKNVKIRNIDETQTTPLIVILGWGNSKQKQLSKYSELYESMGLTTITTTTKSYRCFMFYDSLFGKDSKECIDALESQRDKNKDRKVLFQVFSLPGPSMYLNVLNYHHRFIEKHFGTDRYRKDDVTDVLNIRGTIFDSPVIATEKGVNNAKAMRATATNPVLGYLYGFIGWMVHLIGINVTNRRMGKNLAKYMRSIPVLTPHLVLFSEADSIAPPQRIKDYIEYQRGIGNVVKSHIWPDSRHVLHYRKYPEEYKSIVTSFVHDCVSSDDTSPLCCSQRSSVNTCAQPVTEKEPTEAL